MARLMMSTAWTGPAACTANVAPFSLGKTRNATSLSTPNVPHDPAINFTRS